METSRNSQKEHLLNYKKVLNWKASQNQTIVFYLNTGINDITMITQCIKTSVI